MKKFFITLLIISLATLNVACGSNINNETIVSTNNPVKTEEHGGDNQNENDNEKVLLEINEDTIRNHNETPSTDFEYKDNGNDITISRYIGINEIVVIPKSINGKPVLGLAKAAFSGDVNIRGIYIPESIEEIDGTFATNSNVEIVICEGVRFIGKSSFAMCPKLKTVVLGNNQIKVENFAFSSDENLKELFIPESVLEGDWAYDAFYNTDVTILGIKGSYAETYAQETGKAFKAVEK